MSKVYYLEDITQEDLNKLALERNVLQSNWNSLREWLESRTNNFKEDVSIPILHEQIVCSLILDKMNELEGKDKE